MMEDWDVNSTKAMSAEQKLESECFIGRPRAKISAFHPN